MFVKFSYDSKKKEVKIESDYFNNIREAFSVKNPGARYNRFARFIPQRIYAITPAGYCGVGLIPEILNYLKTLNIPFDIIYDPVLENLLKNIPFLIPTGYPSIKSLEDKLQLRDYQKDAFLKAINHTRGVIELATGGGKTFIIANVVYVALQLLSKDEKVLIIVPDIGLVEQTYKDFTDYGFPINKVTKWTGTHEINLDAKVIIANLGILQSEKSDLSWFNTVGLLIVDECHKLRKGNKVNKLINKIPTHRRVGFTGTLPENEIDKWNIFSILGPVIFKKTTTELREAAGGEYIANAQALALNLEYDRIPDYTSVSASQRYLFELDFIHNSEFRGKVIKNIIEKLNNNCLILVDHIAHGDILYKQLTDLSSKQVYFIQGSVEIEERKKIQEIMESNNNIVCIAISKIFSTGISIKNIHYIMFAAGGKSKIKVLQSIGRGLRTHKDKDMLVLIDIVDDLIYGKKHYKKRKEFYEIEKIKIAEKTIRERT
jgi:superfamily II DNA or RNA helicase